MDKSMTPLKIEIMIKAYYSGDFKESTSKYETSVDELRQAGMLTSEYQTDQTNLTKKGQAYVEKLLSIPIPKEIITYDFGEQTIQVTTNEPLNHLNWDYIRSLRDTPTIS